MNLSQVSINDLLGELARRYNRTQEHVQAIPTWARPALQLVADEHQISLAELMDANTRANYPSHLRHIAMWLIRLTTNRTYAEIGALWGQDYGTVIYALRKISNLQSRDPKFAAFADTLPTKLQHP